MFWKRKNVTADAVDPTLRKSKTFGKFRFKAIQIRKIRLAALFTCLVAALPAQSPIPAERRLNCNDWSGYLPDAAHPEYLPGRVLRVNFHIMNSRDSSDNFRPEEGRAYCKRLLEDANRQLDTNIRNWRSPEGTAVLPKNYRYALWPQAGDDGIYFHFDDSLYYLVYVGKNQNNYNRRVFEKYGIGMDSIVNIFIQVHPDDSIRSPTYKANLQGIALGTCLKVAGLYEQGKNAFGHESLLNHEVGHLLGLAHAWGEDNCPDTDKHPNKCWEWTEKLPCRDQATNNSMDYNAYQIALTPCQIGRVHHTLSSERSRMRRCLIPTWCTLQEGRDVVIRDSVVWSGGRDLEGNLTIAAGGSLRLSCRLSMPAGSQVTVEAGGRLWLDGATLHNACNLQWKGLVLPKKKKKQGEVYKLKPAKWENCPAPE